MALPRLSVLQSGAVGSAEASDDGHVDSTEPVAQSDEVDVVEECAFSSSQTFALRSAYFNTWFDFASNFFFKY